MNHQIETLDDTIQTKAEKKHKFLILLADELITHSEYREAMDKLDEELRELKLKKVSSKAHSNFIQLMYH